MNDSRKPAGLVSEIDSDLRMLRFGAPSQVLGTVNPDETGWDRLRQMYKFTNGKASPELMVVQSVAVTGAFMGFLVGGINYSRQAKERFKRENYVTKYSNKKEAVRHFRDHQMLATIRGGMKLGWRVGLFSTLYSGAVISGSVYRDKLGFLEHIVAGSIAAAAYRCHLGLRTMAFGSLLGALFGVVGGCTTVSISKVSGITLTQLRHEGYRAWAEIWEKEQVEMHKELALKMLKEQQQEDERI